MISGETRAPIGGESVRLYLFVATLGYSRRIFVRAFRHERQSAWLEGMEGAFSHFGGAPQEVLLDNARALVDRHDAVTREVTFNERLIAFARYSGVPAARLRAVPGANQGQGRARRRLCQKQCDRRPPVHQLVGARSAS